MANLAAKVLRTGYTLLKPDPLLSFVRHSLDSTTQDKYQLIRHELDALSTQYESCVQLQADAQGGDHAKIHKKDLAFGQLIAALNVVADGLDKNAQGDTLFIIDAGMDCQKADRARPIDPDVPVIKRVLPTTREGELEIWFEKCVGMRKFAIEWSADSGHTWQNGQYTSRLHTTIKVFPHYENWVRACALGTGDRKSEFSDAAVCRAL